AAPQEAPWLDAVTIHGRDARAWYTTRQLPVFAWAALAGGFFAGVRGPDVVRVYETADNRERLRRTQALAVRRGATPSSRRAWPRSSSRSRPPRRAGSTWSPGARNRSGAAQPSYLKETWTRAR